MKQAIQFFLSAVVLAVAGGCASTNGSSATSATSAEHSVNFPDMSRAWLKNGTFVDVEQLRRIGPGMTKNQVRELISYPHFSEGLFGPREWNYIFNFRTGKGQEFITCQYMVHFDKDMKSQDFHWKGADCEAMLKPLAPVAMAIMPAPAPVMQKRVTLSADALFAFDRSAANDMLPKGRAELDELARALQRQGVEVQSLQITGHADRLGNQAYNQELALRRASTVRDYLKTAGLRVPMQVGSSGAREPVTMNCKGTVRTPELIACLQPDRRVVVDITGQASPK
jgi:OOP family OmpA-OmpF porin